MRPIRAGDRGPAVEDIQRRLVTLGHDLGPTGVDGVFLGATLSAVRAFQRERGLTEDGAVGQETWSALVDATFRLGDRLLFLRFPYLHGEDVRTLQAALNALGFACGTPDGIFGAFTERAVREFQLNAGLLVDGIVGADTVRAVVNLRHVWADKEGSAPVALKVAPARAAEVLASVPIALVPLDEVGGAVAGRVVNLAIAAESEACIRIVLEGESAESAPVVLHLRSADPTGEEPATPVVSVTRDGRAALGPRLAAALSDRTRTPLELVVGIETGANGDEQALQRAAVALLDALCAALGGHGPVVLS